MTSGDAGTTLNCSCGKPVVVPGLRELEALRPKGVGKRESIDTDSSDNAAGRRGLIGIILVTFSFLSQCLTSWQAFDKSTIDSLSREDHFLWASGGLAVAVIGTGHFASARGHSFAFGLLGIFGPLGLGSV